MGWSNQRLPITDDVPEGMRQLIAECFGEPASRPAFRCGPSLSCGCGPALHCVLPTSRQSPAAEAPGGSASGQAPGPSTWLLLPSPLSPQTSVPCRPRPMPACSEIIPRLKGMIRALGPPPGQQRY